METTKTVETVEISAEWFVLLEAKQVFKGRTYYSATLVSQDCEVYRDRGCLGDRDGSIAWARGTVENWAA